MNVQPRYTLPHIVGEIVYGMLLVDMRVDRCLQTSNATAATLKLPIYVEHGLGEWYSPVKQGTGLHPSPVSAEELVPFFSAVDPSWTPTFLVTRKGESVPDLYERGETFLQAFIKRIEEEGKHERILLMSHAATVISLAQALLLDPSIGQNLRVGCCTLSIFDRKHNPIDGGILGGDVWKTRGELASADFLTKGIERDWGMADIQTMNGVVIEDDGVPGTEEEEDIDHGLQPWSKSPSAVARM